MSDFLKKILLFGQGLDACAKRKAISEIMQTATALVSSNGFRYLQSEESFIRSEHGITQFFSLGMEASATTIELRPMVSVRCDAVEAIYHRVSGESDQVGVGSVTVPWQWAIERLGYRPKRIEVFRPSDVSRVKEHLNSFWSGVATRFFAEHENLRLVDVSFNHDHRILKAKLVPDWFPMLARAVIVAKLVSRSDYHSIQKLYRLALHKHGSSIPTPEKAFDMLVQVLGNEKDEKGTTH